MIKKRGPSRQNKLTALGVQRQKTPGYYSDGGNLYLRVSEYGTKGWLFIFTRDGKTREMGLGPFPDVTLEDARAKALEARRALLAGEDPIEKRLAERDTKRLDAAKRITFDKAAAQYIESHRAGWKNAKHASQWESTLRTYASPVFGTLPVAVIDTSLVMQALERDNLWTIKPETASRVRGRIESVLDWATTRGYRTGENPARWKGHLDNLLPARNRVKQVKHHAALPYQEAPAFMAKLRDLEGIAARALEFTILTASRTGEVIGAKWGELNFNEGVWTIPAERMKAKKEHRVPLSTRALTILREMEKVKHSEYVFPGTKKEAPLSNMAMLALIERMGRTDLTVHGFRSTFRDWAGEKTNYPREVIEHALAHQLKDKAEAAYARGTLFEKRAKLMDQWRTYSETKPQKEAGKVIELEASSA
jgi:integrase